MDIKQLEKGKVLLKEKGKLKNRYNRYMTIMIIFFVVGYGFFFTSKFWCDDTGDLKSATRISSVRNWEDRSVQLLSWNYSERQQEMEVQVMIDNQSYDGINTYDISALEKTKGFLNTEVIINEDGFYVVRITDIPKKWNQISFRINLPNDNSSTCKLYTNKEEVAYVDTIEDKTYNQYMNERLDSVIDTYYAMIENLQDDISEQNTLIENCNADIEKLQAEKEFQTPKQIEKTDRQIADAKNTIATAQTAISSDNSNIEEYKERIALTLKQKEKYQ